MRVFCALWTLNPESRSVEVQSEISVAGTCVCTQKGARILTPPPPLLQILSRPALNPPCVVKTLS